MARRRDLLALSGPALTADVIRVVPRESTETQQAHESDRKNAAETGLQRRRSVHDSATALSMHLTRGLPGRCHRTAPGTSRLTSGANVPDSSRRPVPANAWLTTQP